MIANIKSGDLVVASISGRAQVHRVWSLSGRHVVTAPLGSPSPSAAGGAAWDWSRRTGRASGGGSSCLLRLATEDDIYDHELAVATHLARSRVERRTYAGSPATPEAILEAAEELHWLEGGE